MGLGDAAQDKFIVGMRIKYAVLQDRNIGVGTLGHNITAVEYGLLHADALSLLCCDHAGQQVQRLDVAVIKTGILGGVQLDGHVGVVEVVLADGHPQLTGQPLCIDMVAGLNTARDLPVDKMRCAVHFCKQVCQQLAKLLFGHRDMDVQRLGAGVEAVEVILHQIHLAVRADRRVIHAVTEEMHPIIEGNHQFLRRADFTIIIG